MSHVSFVGWMGAHLQKRPLFWSFLCQKISVLGLGARACVRVPISPGEFGRVRRVVPQGRAVFAVPAVVGVLARGLEAVFAATVPVAHDPQRFAAPRLFPRRLQGNYRWACGLIRADGQGVGRRMRLIRAADGRSGSRLVSTKAHATLKHTPLPCMTPPL